MILSFAKVNPTDSIAWHRGRMYIVKPRDDGRWLLAIDGVKTDDIFASEANAKAGAHAYANQKPSRAVDPKNLCAYCGKPTRKGSITMDEGQTAHRACAKEFES